MKKAAPRGGEDGQGTTACAIIQADAVTYGGQPLPTKGVMLMWKRVARLVLCAVAILYIFTIKAH